jgi:putative transposase
LAKAVRNGPPCSRPLEEAEVDHTRLDLMVCDNNGRLLGRPWITTIMDRYTRMILGFSISFTPPSWVSVMETLRIAIQPKDHLLESVCRTIGREKNFEFDWPCFGPIERLFCDNGPEFRSASMKETEIALNMQIVDLPRAAGWLKGRIERWFRTLNQRLIHKLPGTTKSNPKDRGNYKSEDHADLTLNDVNWVVTKWIVDEHNSGDHSRTGESPLVLWDRGIAEIGQPPAPPDDIIVPLTGKVIDRKLGPSGIVWKKLCWNSNAFSALRNRMTDDHRANPVTVRIDPLDLNKVFILDPTRPGERDSWIEGLLETDDPNISGMTLYQYEHYRKTELDARPVFDRARALAQARSNREIYDYVESRKRSKKKVPAKLARLMTDGRNASEHVRGARIAPDESECALASHDHHDPRLLSPPPDERGPYRGRSPIPVTPLERDHPVERFDPEVVNVATRRTHPSEHAAAIPKPRTTRMVVKMRRHLD